MGMRAEHAAQSTCPRHAQSLTLCCCTTWSLPLPASADQKGKFDELIEEHGVRLLIDPAALMHVLGTTMDYIDEPLK